MKLPVPLKLAVLTVATTGFYTIVGQLVPQKEVHPPQEVVFKAEMTQEELLQTGREIMEGKGLCFTCHTVGKSGALRFPDLEGIGARAGSQVAGLSDVDYLAQSIYEPDTFVVPGFNPGMPAIHKPPIGLTDQEILAVMAYLQSMGGTVTVTLESKVWPLGAAGAAPAAGAAASGPGDPAVTQPPG